MPDLSFLQTLLIWSLAINYSILLLWFSIFLLAKNWLKNLHGRWFTLQDNTFDTIHYCCMAIFKLGIILFNLTPLIALSLVQS